MVVTANCGNMCYHLGESFIKLFWWGSKHLSGFPFLMMNLRGKHGSLLSSEHGFHVFMFFFLNFSYSEQF